MNNLEIQTKVKEILNSNLGISTTDFSLKSNLKDLGADSLEKIENMCRYIGNEIQKNQSNNRQED